MTASCQPSSSEAAPPTSSKISKEPSTMVSMSSGRSSEHLSSCPEPALPKSYHLIYVDPQQEARSRGQETHRTRSVQLQSLCKILRSLPPHPRRKLRHQLQRIRGQHDRRQQRRLQPQRPGHRFWRGQLQQITEGVRPQTHQGVGDQTSLRGSNHNPQDRPDHRGQARRRPQAPAEQELGQRRLICIG